MPHKGLSPLENSGNNVVVPELNITGDLKLIQQNCAWQVWFIEIFDSQGNSYFCDGQGIYIRTDFWGMNKMLHNTAKYLFFKTVT